MEYRLLPSRALQILRGSQRGIRVMTTRSTTNVRNEAGFTLLEVLVVVAVLGTLAAMAMLVTPNFTESARANAGLAQMLDALRSAREVAISQRRNVRVQFIGVNGVQTVREDLGTPPSTTVLRTVELENQMQIRLDPNVLADTPDLFGRIDPVTMDSAAPWRFTSEGTFVGPSGDPINGTVFLSIPNQANSARAVTILGATALIRVWRWNGREWVE